MEHKVPASVHFIGHECRAGGALRIDREICEVDAVAVQPIAQQPAECIIANRADESGGECQARTGIGKVCRRAAGKWPFERSRAIERQAGLRPHHLDERLAKRDDLRSAHWSLRTVSTPIAPRPVCTATTGPSSCWGTGYSGAKGCSNSCTCATSRGAFECRIAIYSSGCRVRASFASSCSALERVRT